MVGAITRPVGDDALRLHAADARACAEAIGLRERVAATRAAVEESACTKTDAVGALQLAASSARVSRRLRP